MSEPAEKQLNLKDFALVLDTQQRIHALPTGPELYLQLDTQFNQFHGCVLLSEYAFSASWSSFEMHPAANRQRLLAQRRYSAG